MLAGLKKIFLIISCLLIVEINFGQELVYKPINPSFALGETFNASWLLQSAQAQNDIKEPVTSSYKRDALEEFSSSLNRSILSQLSQRILSDTFGEGMMSEGTYEFGTFNLEINSVSEGLSVRIIEASTGNETEIIIPYF